LPILQLREDGEREDFPAGLLGNRQSTQLIAQVTEGRLKVQAEGVVDLGGNASKAESFLQCITFGDANGELVIDVVELRRGLRRTSHERGQILLCK
jgi:hypothetical protein